MIDHRKKVVLFGMCYMPALATILNLSEKFAANFRVVPYATGGPSPDLSVNFGISDEELSQCSVIIYTARAFPGWGYSEFYEDLERRFPESALKIRIPYPSFHPLWPFHTSVATQPQYMDWLYGDVNVQRRVYEGAAPQQIVDEYLSLDLHEMLNLDDVLESTVASDRVKEAESDVKYLDFTLENFKNFDLFSCLNHPSNILMAHMMNQVLDRLEIPRIEDAVIAALPQLLPPAIPIHPSIVRHFGLTYAPPDRKYEIEPGRLMTYAEYLYSMAATCPVRRTPSTPFYLLFDPVTEAWSLNFLPLVFRHSWVKPPVMFTDRDAVLFYAEHFSSAFPRVATLFRALYHDVDELAGDISQALRFYDAWLDAPPDGSGFVCAVGSHAEDGEPVFYICPPTESLEQLSKTEFLIRLSERCPHLFGALFAAAQQLYREGQFEPALIALRKQIERQESFFARSGARGS